MDMNLIKTGCFFLKFKPGVTIIPYFILKVKTVTNNEFI